MRRSMTRCACARISKTRLVASDRHGRPPLSRKRERGPIQRRLTSRRETRNARHPPPRPALRRPGTCRARRREALPHVAPRPTRQGRLDRRPLADAASLPGGSAPCGRARQVHVQDPRRHRRRLRPGGAAGDPGTRFRAARPDPRLRPAGGHGADVRRRAVRRPPPPRPTVAAVEGPLDAPAEEPAGVRRELLPRHPAGGRDPAGRLRRLVPRRPPRHWRGLGRVRAVPRHDLGRADEACLRRCPAPGLAPPRRTLRRRPLHRPQGARPGRSAGAAGRGKTQRLHLEPVARVRRLRAVRQVRGDVPGVRRRPAAEPEEADPGHGHRPGRRQRREVRRQPLSRQTAGRARRRPAPADRRAGWQGPGRRRHPVVLHHLPGLRRGVPDDDRARRRHRRHAPPPDPGERRHAEQGRRGAGQPDRHRQPRRLRPRRPGRTGRPT